MATDLPSVGNMTKPKSKRKPKGKPQTMPVETASVSVPMASISHGYEPRRCDVQRMTSVQKSNLQKITNGLMAEGAKLASGAVVKRQQDAVKWILENLEASK